MRFMVCGVGSIGERHISNLLKLGYENIILYRSRNLPLRNIKRQFPVFLDIEAALAEKPEIAIITNPTSLHSETAIQCLKAGMHVFMEKPICVSLAESERIEKALEKSGKIFMTGYMMRFHPCLTVVKSWLEQGLVGDVVYLRTEWGEYLPDWHPYEDYRDSYAARKKMGGGPVLTLSHELDTVCWLLGLPSGIVAMANYKSDLELTVEHGVDILMQFDSQATANIHLDYFQKPPSREMTIIGSKGKITFSYYASEAKLYVNREENGPIDCFELGEKFDRNEMFVEEMKHFINCIYCNQQAKPDFYDGMNVIKIVEKIMRSIDGKEKRII